MEVLIIVFFFAVLFTLRCWVFYKTHYDKDLGYYVYCPEGYKPRYIHATKKSAQKEADRLANLYPYSEFQVLKIIEKRKGRNFIDTDEIPF